MLARISPRISSTLPTRMAEPKPSPPLGPQERDAGGAEAGEADDEEAGDRPVEELAARRAEGVGVGRDPRGRCGRAGGDEFLAGFPTLELGGEFELLARRRGPTFLACGDRGRALIAAAGLAGQRTDGLGGLVATGCSEQHHATEDDEGDDGDRDDSGGFHDLPILPIRSHHSSKKRPTFQGNTKLKPGPRKNEPMITRTAQNIKKMVNSEMTNLRSFGLFEGLRSM